MGTTDQEDAMLSVCRGGFWGSIVGGICGVVIWAMVLAP